jgi:hypothetical protein
MAETVNCQYVARQYYQYYKVIRRGFSCVGVSSIQPDQDDKPPQGRDLLVKAGETLPPSPPGRLRRTSAGFDVEVWLRRWQSNGNATELAKDGRIWLVYGRRGSRRRRDALELELRHAGGAEAVKAYLDGRSP